MPAPKPTPETIAMGRRLADLRESLGLTQQDVYQRLGIVEQTYRNYEKGAARIPITAVDRWADAFGLSVGTFLDRVGVLPTAPVDPDLEMSTLPTIAGIPGVSVEFRQWDAEYKRRPPHVQAIIRATMNAILAESETA